MLLIFGARVGLIAAQGLFPADIRTGSWKLSLQQAVTIGVFFGAATAIIAGKGLFCFSRCICLRLYEYLIRFVSAVVVHANARLSLFPTGYFGRELHYAENGRQLVDIDSQDTVSSEVDFGTCPCLHVVIFTLYTS